MGLGGGFVVIPLLTGFGGFSQHTAHAISLAAVAATSLGGCASYGLHGQVEIATALPIALGATVSIGLGARLAARMSTAQLKRAFGVFIVLVAPLVPGKPLLMAKIEEYKRSESGAAPGQSEEGVADVWRWLALGAFSGLSAGVFGVGGGAIMVPAMGFMSDMPHHAIIGTSLAAMALPSAAGAFQHYRLGNIQPRFALPVAAGTLFGSYLGGQLAQYVPEDQLRIVFGLFMGVLGVRQIWRKP